MFGLTLWGIATILTATLLTFIVHRFTTEKSDLLLAAIQKGQVPKVKNAIENGADVNVRDRSGKTPLILAVVAMRPDMVEILMGAGADLILQDNDHKTAMMYAKECENGNCIELLKQFGGF